MYRFIIAVNYILFLTLIQGCISTGQKSPETVPYGNKATAKADESTQWYAVCFRMPFDSKQEPNWTTDLIIANQVIAPIIEKYYGNIRLWRFHRRAANDRAGHQFSFIYYASVKDKKHIDIELKKSQSLSYLLDKGKIVKVLTNCRRASEPAQRLEATSDPNWDLRIQKTWPYFIMGVSAHWLALIREIKSSLPNSEANGDMYSVYQQIEDELIKLWQQQGQHAYFHHLSAVFGYEPLIINRWMRF